MADTNSIYCPHCHKYTYLTIRSHYTKNIARQLFQYQIGECNNCNNCVLIMRPATNSSSTSNSTILKVYPAPLPKEVDDVIPDNIKSDIIEARICLSVNANRAAAVLARRALQVICIEKGSKKNKLVEQVDELFTKSIITDEIKKWAHEIRYVGNDAAHPNDTSVSRDDAEEVLELLDSMCDTLYIAPAKAENRRRARESRKGNSI